MFSSKCQPTALNAQLFKAANNVLVRSCAYLTRPNCVRVVLDAAKIVLCLMAFFDSSAFRPSFTNASLQMKRPSSSQSRCVGTCNAGVCVDGMCVCPPGWTGAQCDICFGRVRKNGTAKGFITDGPVDYSPLSRCIWIIENEGGSRPLLLRLEEFFTECCWDTLYIYDGDGVYNSLLGAFSGSLAGREVLARSGMAIVYFVTDLAFNLSGFNVTYEYGVCVHDCSKHGRCLPSGVCDCERGYTGSYCQWQVCLAEMNGHAGPCKHHTRCQDGRCACTKHTHGDYCQELVLNPAWDTLLAKNDEIFSSRASHAASMVGDEIWFFSGISFDAPSSRQKKANALVFFDIENAEWRSVNVKGITPVARYDHSMVYYDRKLYVFGGVINENMVTNELWCFHLDRYEWELLSAHADAPLFVPAAVAGHTAHVIDHEMHVFFGYNPYEEYVYRVQIYSFGTGKWRLGEVDAFITGRFGHSSVMYRELGKNPMVLIYGGFSALSRGYSYALSDELILYDVTRQIWTNLGGTDVSLYRHSAALLNGVMYIVGGNAHNETSKSRHSDCYSNQLLAFDTVCREWLRVSARDAGLTSRYGHVAVTTDEHMYVVGGFDGTMRNDILKFTPAHCDHQAKSAEECEATANGVRCVFTNKTCQRASPDTSYRQPFLAFIKTDNPRLQTGCALKSAKLVACMDIKECADCVQAGCGWCEDTLACLNSDTACADGMLTDRKSCLSSEAKLREKTARTERSCALAANCFACRRLRHCAWLTVEAKHVCVSQEDESLIVEEQNRIQAERLASLNSAPLTAPTQPLNSGLSSSSSTSHLFSAQQPSSSSALLSPSSSLLSVSEIASLKSSQQFLLNGKMPLPRHLPLNDVIVFPLEEDRENATCPAPCFIYGSCQSCVQAHCTWCQSTRRCISSDTQLIAFPYGQCQSWVTTAQNVCHFDPYDCELQRTCSECQLVGPRCGWCDDGSGTGLGRCVAGTSAGPLEPDVCLLDHWYFTGEPVCQCNGHSTCALNSTLSAARRKCLACANRTKGEHCEQCESGYFGDSRNGGICRECQCNGQATHCNTETGDCYCFTKGVTGPHCDKCEPKYEGDPAAGKTCIYQLLIDFIFTFKFDDDNVKDKYVNQVNFYSIPPKRDTDVQFTVTCESDSGAKVFINLSTIVLEGRPPHTKQLMAGQLCTASGIKRTYSATDPGYAFGTDANTTFHVRVTDFVTPMKIVISFAQSPPINWVLFFVIFAACFIVLLVVAGLLWMIKLRIEWYRNIRRRHEEIEEMASRPFASVQLQLSGCGSGGSDVAAGASSMTSDTAALVPTPLAIEPCGNYQAGVYTIMIRLPTGGRAYTPYGTTGLAVGSALCQLTHAQLALLQPTADGTGGAGTRLINRKSVLRRYIPFMRSTAPS